MLNFEIIHYGIVNNIYNMKNENIAKYENNIIKLSIPKKMVVIGIDSFNSINNLH